MILETMDEVERILENEDISLLGISEQRGEQVAELEFYSDEGEDVVITVFFDGTASDFVDKFKKCAEDFDSDEHAEMWIMNRKSVRGVPQDMRDLLNDAEAIKAKLEEVAELLQNGGERGEQEFMDYMRDTYSTAMGEPITRNLISNILDYAKGIYPSEQQYKFLCQMFPQVPERIIRNINL